MELRLGTAIFPKYNWNPLCTWRKLPSKFLHHFVFFFSSLSLSLFLSLVVLLFYNKKRPPSIRPSATKGTCMSALHSFLCAQTLWTDLCLNGAFISFIGRGGGGGSIFIVSFPPPHLHVHYMRLLLPVACANTDCKWTPARTFQKEEGGNRGTQAFTFTIYTTSSSHAHGYIIK